MYCIVGQNKASSCLQAPKKSRNNANVRRRGNTYEPAPCLYGMAAKLATNTITSLPTEAFQPRTGQGCTFRNEECERRVFPASVQGKS